MYIVDRKAVNELKKRYSTLSRGELIEIRNIYGAQSSEHIAASHILDEMDQEKYTKVFKVSKSTKIWTIIAAIAAAVSAGFVIAQWVYQHYK